MVVFFGERIYPSPLLFVGVQYVKNNIVVVDGAQRFRRPGIRRAFIPGREGDYMQGLVMNGTIKRKAGRLTKKDLQNMGVTFNEAVS